MMRTQRGSSASCWHRGGGKKHFEQCAFSFGSSNTPTALPRHRSRHPPLLSLTVYSPLKFEGEAPPLAIIRVSGRRPGARRPRCTAPAAPGGTKPTDQSRSLQPHRRAAAPGTRRIPPRSPPAPWRGLSLGTGTGRGSGMSIRAGTTLAKDSVQRGKQTVLPIRLQKNTEI